jgi:DNA polymerase III delta prime subunit
MAHRIQQLSNKQEAVALWIWEPYIPARGLTVLAGPPGVGKTWLALAMAARVSMEKNVLLLTDKADWGCIVRPRLDAMAANVNNVYGIDTSPDAMRPGEWLSGKLGALIREKQAGIVIVDTVELFANTLATRAALERMGELAAECDTAFLAVTGLPRKTGPAQSVLSLRCDGERRVMTHRRSSMGPTGPAQAFNIADDGRMEWAI